MHGCRAEATIVFKSAPTFSLGASTLTRHDAPPGLSSSSFGGRRGIVPRIIPRPARLSSRSGLTALKAEIDLAATLQNKMPDRSSPTLCPPHDTSYAQSFLLDFNLGCVYPLLHQRDESKMAVSVCAFVHVMLMLMLILVFVFVFVFVQRGDYLQRHQSRRGPCRPVG
jgi:hypothetical protein